MSYSKGQVKVIGENVEAQAGPVVRAYVMNELETLPKSAKSERVAHATKEAMARLERELPPEAAAAVMQKCGYNCILHNVRLLKLAQARRRKAGNLEAFLKTEVEHPITGTLLEWDGRQELVQYYTPRSFSRPMRCYCSLMRGLPAGETASMTYCNCSRGFVEKFWEAVLERPVKVELLASAISGADECKFRIVI